MTYDVPDWAWEELDHEPEAIDAFSKVIDRLKTRIRSLETSLKNAEKKAKLCADGAMEANARISAAEKKAEQQERFKWDANKQLQFSIKDVERLKSQLAAAKEGIEGAVEISTTVLTSDDSCYEAMAGWLALYSHPPEARESNVASKGQSPPDGAGSQSERRPVGAKPSGAPLDDFVRSPLWPMIHEAVKKPPAKEGSE